jgi:hypothetical protein
MLRTDFNEPVDFEKFSDAEVVEYARESNRERLNELRKKHM